MIYVVQENKKTIDSPVQWRKAHGIIKRPKSERRRTTEAGKWNNRTDFPFIPFREAAIVKLMDAWYATYDLQRWRTVGNCIVFRHAVCSRRHNETPSAISHSPDIQENSVARSHRRRMVGGTCRSDGLTYLCSTKTCYHSLKHVYIYNTHPGTPLSDDRINNYSLDRRSKNWVQPVQQLLTAQQ